MLPLWKALPAPRAGAPSLSTLTPRPRSPEVPRPLPGPGAPGAAAVKLQTMAANASVAGQEALFANVVFGMVVVAAVDFFATALAAIPRETLSIRFKMNLKEEVFKAVMRQDTEFFDTYSSAEILQRINEDVNTFADQALGIPFNCVKNISDVAFAFVSLITIIPAKLFVVAVPLMITTGIIKFLLLKRVIRSMMNAGNVRRVTDTRVGELLSAKALQTIRSFGKEAEEADQEGCHNRGC